ncbi:MAG: orotidine-5'-phosphate decarboxylase [Deltaproteobacteria bacterium]|nr:MAG: orotidine-5'-phosphate decarboxylase [Deltaproteobacteria bacterium]
MKVTPADRIIPALDTADADVALGLAERLSGTVTHVKVGLELFSAHGPDLVRRIRTLGLEVFLDLKLHDIPNTVRGAARAVAGLGVRLLTVHALGGAEMVEAAVAGATEGAEAAGVAPPEILAVTVLTSLDAAALERLGLAGPPDAAVLRLARSAAGAGAHGIVCSPHEAATVRQALGAGARIVTPGVRPVGASAGDQARIATPEAALRAGADQLVVGRPIRESPDPVAAAQALVQACARVTASVT